MVSTNININKMIGKNNPPMCKIFVWLVIQSRLNALPPHKTWVAKLAAAHMLFQCCYSVRLCHMIKDLLRLHQFEPSALRDFNGVKS